MAETVISFSDLRYAYRSGHFLFNNCSSTVGKGEVFTLLGPNGRGKVTLFKLMPGALKPTEEGLSVKGQFAFVPQLFHGRFDY